jgi:nicotinamide-nucleotide amidase
MSIFRAHQIQLGEQTLSRARANNIRIATAESCTGGLIGALLTEIPGSSDVFECGFITYSNRAKTEMLGVPAELIAEWGAVSEPVARRMAEGAVAHSRAQAAVAVTGVAGPGGGTAEKPVGLVHIAAARKNLETRHEKHLFGEIGRGPIRMASVEAALKLLLQLL